MKLAVVVQRYGADISGGAELHARYVAEMLARRHDVEVLTTCAHDYVTWRETYPAGTETINGVTVRRFPVAHERDPEAFGRKSAFVFGERHSVADEIDWLESEGPASPALIEHVATQADTVDFFFFFSYRYYHAWHGIRRVASKAILVPTAERDAALGLSTFGPIFRSVRGLMYNTPEERALIQQVSGNTGVPGVVVGIGSDLPRETAPERFRRKYQIHEPFVIYVGRIDANKGCAELFDYFRNYRPRLGQRLTLVLVGTSILPIPTHPHIRHLGFVPDRDKFDAMAAADALIMPSYYESLSMVALEAWGLGRPVLANGRCDVLRGQCIRSRAGLYYESFEEFSETLFSITSYRALNAGLGENGRRFYERHYAWPVIERKYGDMLARLARENEAGPVSRPIEPLPGWISRRRRTLPPAQQVVDALARGPVLTDDPDPPGPLSTDPPSWFRPAPRPMPDRPADRPADRPSPRPDRAGGARTATDRPATSRPGSERATSDRPPLDRPGPDRKGPDRPGADRTGPNRPGQDRTATAPRGEARRRPPDRPGRPGRGRRPPRRNG